MAAQESKLEEALLVAEEEARKLLLRALGRSASFHVILKLVEGEGGRKSLVVEIAVTRPRIDKKTLEEVVEAAIEAARQAFERVYLETVGRRGS